MVGLLAAGQQYFQPCLGHHTGTGYSANFRPVLYYTSSLDRYDNPHFGLSLLDSFESQSKRHYRHLVQPDGTEALVCSGSRPRESGYLQLHTQPRPVRANTHSYIGRREESGYTEGTSLQPNTFLPHHINMCSSGFILNAPNITSLSHTPTSPQHFLTHYQSKFCDRASVEQVRADWMKGGVQTHRQSGYSERDSSRHKLGYHTLDAQLTRNR
ncbi:hypothetical protein E1301_Tti015276 [Triplophysa tibetana]|uniref:Protein phosphatase 1 regulatory subunit 32 n=1 Tax=Triplophysa tibetana TaxID=1572043 RepID=A0A5A9PWH7_9TELE|nr:hypothetical protein E1301_Tti015276 [Triplophysa tibetana]